MTNQTNTPIPEQRPKTKQEINNIDVYKIYDT